MKRPASAITASSSSLGAAGSAGAATAAGATGAARPVKVPIGPPAFVDPLYMSSIAGASRVIQGLVEDDDPSRRENIEKILKWSRLLTSSCEAALE